MTEAELRRAVKDEWLSKRDAQAVRRHHKTKAAREAREAREAAEQEARDRAAQERREHHDRMAPAWAEFVMAHRPTLAADVISGAASLFDTVEWIEQQTGCEVGCDHRPLTYAESVAWFEWCAANEDQFAALPDDEVVR